MCDVTCDECKFCILVMNSEREGVRLCMNKKSPFYAQVIEDVTEVRDCEEFIEGLSIC